jgi:hypothetical protein
MVENTQVRVLLDAFRLAGPFAGAKETHDGLAAVAGALGWTVTREPSSPYPSPSGLRRPARMDFIARRASVVVACELDRASPRRRTIAKLTGYAGATYRVVILREGGRAPFRLSGFDILVLSTRARRR